MKQAIQKRTLETRARMTAAAEALISEGGYEALRVEDVVKGAGVAKGTFFAHFSDKDALMDQLIGARLDAELDRIEELPTPQSVAAIVEAMTPMLAFMTSERYVFDIVLRYSGAALADEIGPIAAFFGRHGEVVARWLSDGPFRRDVSPEMLAEGVGAFTIQVLALHFCALHNDYPLADRLADYLTAWLLPRPAL